MANRSHHPKTPVDQRFWTKVDIRMQDECWPWKASRHRQGYGQIGDSNGGLLRAHRVAYELSGGKIPEGMSVLHRCDNPPCCNPMHLFIGTQRDNMRDAARKGRAVGTRCKGTANGMSKLTEDAVRHIRSIGDSVSQQKIASSVGVSQTLIGLVLRRRIWKHIS